MRVLAIDPGPKTSGVVLWDGAKVIYANEEIDNRKIFPLHRAAECGAVEAFVLEKIESFGMSVGASVFETAFETGRLYAEAELFYDLPVSRIGRREVKLHLCGSSRAKDTNIRQALIDRFGAPGTKKNPGPLYGVKSHAWSALALAVTYMDLHCK